MLEYGGGDRRLGVVAFGSQTAGSANNYTNNGAGSAGVTYAGEQQQGPGGRHVPALDWHGMGASGMGMGGGSNQLWYEQYMRGVVEKHYGLQPGTMVYGEGMLGARGPPPHSSQLQGPDGTAGSLLPATAGTATSLSVMPGAAGKGGGQRFVSSSYSEGGSYLSPMHGYSPYFQAAPLGGPGGLMVQGNGARGNGVGGGSATRGPAFQPRGQPLAPLPTPTLDGLVLQGRGAGRYNGGGSDGPYHAMQAGGGGGFTLDFHPEQSWEGWRGQGGWGVHGKHYAGTGDMGDSTRFRKQTQQQQHGSYWGDWSDASPGRGLQGQGVVGHGSRRAGMPHAGPGTKAPGVTSAPGPGAYGSYDLTGVWLMEADGGNGRGGVGVTSPQHSRGNGATFAYWQSANSPPRRNPNHHHTPSPPHHRQQQQLQPREFPMYGSQNQTPHVPKPLPQFLRAGNNGNYPRAHVNRSYPPAPQMHHPDSMPPPSSYVSMQPGSQASKHGASHQQQGMPSDGGIKAAWPMAQDPSPSHTSSASSPSHQLLPSVHSSGSAHSSSFKTSSPSSSVGAGGAGSHSSFSAAGSTSAVPTLPRATKPTTASHAAAPGALHSSTPKAAVQSGSTFASRGSGSSTKGGADYMYHGRGHGGQMSAGGDEEPGSFASFVARSKVRGVQVPVGAASSN